MDKKLNDIKKTQIQSTELQDIFNKLSNKSKAWLLGTAEGLLLTEQQFLTDIPYEQKEIKGNKNHG